MIDDIVQPIAEPVPVKGKLHRVAGKVGLGNIAFNGISQVLLGFWAAGSWVRSAFLLVALVAGVALAHGIADIVLAFRLRGTISGFTGRGAAAPGPAAP